MKSLKLFFIFIIIVLQNKFCYAQCSGGTFVSNITVTNVWQTIVNIDGMDYYTFNATAGQIYEFSFCSASGGGSSIFDTQITILTAAGVNIPGAYNNDFCGSQSYLYWPCTTTGSYRVLVSRFNCNNRNNMGTLAYRFSLPLSCATLGTGATNVLSLPYSSGSGTTCGQINDLNSSNMISCGSPNYLDGEDRVWIFTPLTTGNVTINLSSAGTYNGLVLYRGCPLIGNSGVCVAAAQSSSGNQTLTRCLQGGQTYYLILDVFPTPNCNAYSNLTISAPSTSAGCTLPGGSVSIGTLPYNITAQSTCGNTNDLTTSNTISCGNANYLTGEDVVYTFTPTTTGDLTITLTSTGSYTGLMLYDGCPLSNTCSGTPANCVGYTQSSTGTKALCANVTAGRTYYLIIDSWSSPICNPYSLTITAPSPTILGETCASAVLIGSLPFSLNNESTACTGNNYNNASLGSCASTYESGEDKVYRYTATAAECIGISITGANSNAIGFIVYSGCPGNVGTTCIYSNGGATSGVLAGSVTLPSAGTYYIIIDSWAPPANVNYNIAISSFGSGQPNDLPCNAIPLSLGIPVVGNNNCSGFSGEPVTNPSCWITPNVRNTVWYSAIAPPSGILRIRGTRITLSNPQLALYSGTCGTGMTLVWCNDDTVGCGSTYSSTADIYRAGLTPGTTYYIAIDGYAGQTGTFNIIAADGSVALPSFVSGQDCGSFLPVCSPQLSVGNPGFQNFGSSCDFNGGSGNCLLAGERASAWFEINIAVNGSLAFNLVPKDWLGSPSTTATDYDFAIWKIGGAGGTSCSGILAGDDPIACNYSFLGVTGLNGATNGNAPAAYPGFGSAYNSSIPVSAGDRFALVVSNFSNSTSGFDLIFPNPAILNTASTESIWSGGVDIDWHKPENWGGCPIPTCSRDGIINGGFTIQPTIFNTAVTEVKSIRINPGAVLTINGGRNLDVCENFTNFGSLTAASNSIVNFKGVGNNQDITGNLTATNAFGSIEVRKVTGGTVKMLQNLDQKGNFSMLTPSSPLSIFDVNGLYHKITASISPNTNFVNYTVYNSNGGTLEFTGTSAQTYTNFNSANPDLNKVIINNSNLAGITLGSEISIGSAGTLTFTNGRINTTASGFKVRVRNRTPSAVNAGNLSSFIIGSGRHVRYINSTGTYEFPLGSAVTGYQRAKLDFNNASFPTSIDSIQARFITYPALPSPLGATNCSVIFNGATLDNGKWQFISAPNPTSGRFDLTLFNSGYTNATGMSGWTIMSSTDGGSTWALANGACVPGPVTAVQRLQMTGLTADFGIPQSPNTPLPVEWLSFSAKGKDNNHIILNWATASEEDNNGFEILRAEGNNNFKQIGWVDGNGNSFNVNNYEFKDYNVEANKTYYYKLRQIDYNGNYMFSSIVSAKLKSKPQRINLFPNPTNESATLIFDCEKDSKLNINITNVLGATISVVSDLLHNEDIFEMQLNFKKLGLSSGYYLLQVSDGISTETQKLFITE